MPTLQQALTQFLRVERSPYTATSYKSWLCPLVEGIGPRRDVRRVTFDDLHDYITQYRAERPGLRPSTILQYIRITQIFFSWCVRQKYITASPAEDLSARDPGRLPVSRAVPPDELAAMLDAARHHPRNFAMLMFLIDTGCRVGGAASLTLDRLDLNARSAILLEKGHRWHTAYFGEATGEALGAWLKVRPSVEHAYVWTTTGSRGNPLSRGGIGRVIAKLAEKAGASKAWGPHAIRHSVGHAYADAGVPPSITQHKLGHSSPVTTLKFYYPQDEIRVKTTSQQMPLAPLRQAAEPPASEKVIDFRRYRKINSSR